jgi:hypothetical protein
MPPDAMMKIDAVWPAGLTLDRRDPRREHRRWIAAHAIDAERPCVADRRCELGQADERHARARQRHAQPELAGQPRLSLYAARIDR